MRLTAIAAGSTMLAASFAGLVEAAEITEQGARNLQAELTRFLPDWLAKSGFIAVTPDGTRYAIVYQFAKLLEGVDSKVLTVDGLQPMKMFAAPLDGGLWKVEGNDSIDISGQAKPPGEAATHFNYSVGTFVYSGVFDPAITYFRSGESRVKDLRATSITGSDKVVFRLEDLLQTFGAVDGSDGATVDFTSNSTGSSFYQQMTSRNPDVTIEVRAENVAAQADAKGVLARELRELVIFLADHLQEERLTQASSARLKELVRASMPMFSSAQETVTASNVSVTTHAGDFGLRQVAYNLSLSGLSEASRLGLSFSTDGFDLGSLRVPAAYAPFVPETTETQIHVPGLNFRGFVDDVLKFDLANPENISPAELEKAGKAIFPNDTVTVEFPKIAARSPAYDLEVSGNVTSSVSRSDQFALDASIYARDYDATIAAVQKAARSDPQLNQLSLGLMMAKGFAKTEPDGRQRWDVRIGSDGSVSVNGQVLTGAR